MKGIPVLRMNVDRGISHLSVKAFFALLIFCSFCETSCAGHDLGIIEPQDLRRELKTWVVLDARPKSEWSAGHIPGALPFSWEDYTRTDKEGVPYRVWPADELAQALGGMGIGEKTPIVVYGDADKSWGGEGWTCWTLLWLGHQGPVRLLGGGINAWRGNNFPVSAEPGEKRAQAVYHINPRPQLDIPTAEIEQRGTGMFLIDTRSTLEWFKGHIPGAIHISWTKFYTGKDRRPLPPDALKRLLTEYGVDAGRPVVYYCAGGVRSSYAWLVHELSGLPSARNYEGGMEAWQRRHSR